MEAIKRNDKTIVILWISIAWRKQTSKCGLFLTALHYIIYRPLIVNKGFSLEMVWVEEYLFISLQIIKQFFGHKLLEMSDSGLRWAPNELSFHGFHVIGLNRFEKNVHLFVTPVTVTVLLFGRCVRRKGVDIFFGNFIGVCLRIRQSSSAVKISFSFGFVWI